MTKPMKFNKSSYCGPGNCVEVGIQGNVAIRDSKNPSTPALTFSPDEWRAFVAGVKANEFDV